MNTSINATKDINEKELRELAYNIWEAEGRPTGQAERHWNMALALAESDGEQYMAGETLAGENFLGDSIMPEDQAAILADDRQYGTMTSNGQNFPEDNLGQQQAAGGGQKSSGQAENSGSKDKTKKKSGKSKSSGNILV